MQKQGVGKGMYERLVQHARESGATELHSGGVVSPEASHVWESLSKKYPVDRISTKEGSTYPLKLDQPTPRTVPFSPRTSPLVQQTAMSTG